MTSLLPSIIPKGSGQACHPPGGESVRSAREITLGLSFWKNLPTIHFSDDSKNEYWVDSSRMTKNVDRTYGVNGFASRRMTKKVGKSLLIMPSQTRNHNHAV